ncbi:hypothetical protein MP638_006328 [Amoeboaphelidium occidentale]|nr:hypothetical protein MP638_006328 [Amoeboaphelidium occidentale]
MADSLEENFVLEEEHIEQEGNVHGEIEAEEPVEDGNTKKRKQPSKQKPKEQKKVKRECLEVSNSHDIRDHLHQELLKTHTKILYPQKGIRAQLTAIEMKDFEDQVLPESFVTKGSLKEIIQEIKEFDVLVISLNALRCIDLINKAKEVTQKGDLKAAKLFSRHMKIEEQKKLLGSMASSGKRGIAMGTPNRILKLFQESSEYFQSVKLIVIDGYVDDKNRSVIDLEDCRKDLYTLIKDHLRSIPFTIVSE